MINGEVLKHGDQVEVGDVIVTKHPLGGVHSYPVTRLTKTLAKSKRAKDGYEHTFKRYVSGDMTHPYQSWNTIGYKVFRPDIQEDVKVIKLESSKEYPQEKIEELRKS